MQRDPILQALLEIQKILREIVREIKKANSGKKSAPETGVYFAKFLELLFSIVQNLSSIKRWQDQARLAPINKIWFDKQEALLILNTSSQTLYRRRRDGNIKFKKDGGKFYYHRDSLFGEVLPA